MVGFTWNELKYEDHKSFRDSIALGDDVLSQLRSLPAAKCLDRMQRMVDQARSSLNSGDLENAYRYYSRGADIASCCRQSKEWEKIAKNPAVVERLKSIMLECIQAMEKYDIILRQLYKEKKTRSDIAAEATLDITAKKNGPRRVIVNNSERVVVDAKDLLRRFEAHYPKKMLLIVDLRSKKDEHVVYNDERTVTTLELPEKAVVKGMTFSNLSRALQPEQLKTLNRLPCYDNVAMLNEDGQLDDDRYGFVIQALEVYNQTSKPQRPLVIVDGGFKKWKLYYPSYVRGGEGVKRKEYTSDRIDQIVAEFRKHCETVMPSTLMYPDLTPLRPARPPSPADTLLPPPQPFFPPSPIETSEGAASLSGNVDPAPSARPRSTDIEISSYPPELDWKADAKAEPPEVPSRVSPSPTPRVTIPSFDRSTKPVLNGGASGRPPLPAPRPSLASHPSTAAMVPRPQLDRSTKPAVIDSKQKDILLSVYQAVREQLKADSMKALGRVAWTGLVNCGNTCFMNATLQALFRSPQLKNIFTAENFLSHLSVNNRMGTGGVISAAFSALMDLMWTGQFSVIRPTRFLRMFAQEVNSSMSDGRQHDAQEFQLFLLDALHEDTNTGLRECFSQDYKGGQNIRVDADDFALKNARFTKSPIQKLFNHRGVAEIECLSCREISATFEESSQLSLELPSSTQPTTLDACIKAHFKMQVLDGDACWNCPRCKQPRAAKRKTALWTLPPILVVHLKRFSLDGSGWVKNSLEVNAPLSSLDLVDCLHRQAPPPTVSTYNLYAITNHTGTLTSGHYTSIAVERGGSCLKCDDERILAMSAHDISASGAFIFFYRRDDVTD